MTKKKETLALVRDHKCRYIIRISCPTDPVTNEYEVALSVRELIADMTGATPEIETATPDNDTPYEILIGKTCREGELYPIDRIGITGDEYDVVVYNKKIFFVAESDEGLWRCAISFAQDFLGYDPWHMAKTKKAQKKDYDCTLPTFVERGNGDLPYHEMLSDTVRKMSGISVGPVCYSSPDVYARLLSYTRSRVPDAFHKARLVHNSSIPPCDCPACRAAAEEEGTPYGAYFRLVSKIANEVLPIWPEKRIVIAAYMETLTPPAHVVFPSNVDVLVCQTHLCSAQPVNSPASKQNREFARVLKKWASIARTKVLDFTSDYFYYPAPLPNYFTVYENVHYYASIGVRGCYLQWNTVQADLEFGPARKKIYRALLAKPEMSLEEYRAVVLSALQAVYGYDNAPHLLAYMDLMANAAVKDYTATTRPAQIVPVPRKRINGKNHYDLSVITEAYRLWNTVHPYHESFARSRVYLNQMLFNRYQSTPVGHAFVQFSEWFNEAIENFDKTDVLNTIFEQVDKQ